VKEFATEAVNHVRRMAFDEGLDIPGYKKQEQDGDAGIPSDKLDDVYNISGLPNNIFQRALKITLGTLETEYAQYHGMTQKAGKERLRNEIGHLIERGKPKKFLKAVKATKKKEEF
jgi:hypothetical protein